jgi:antitoxin VapB
MPTLILRNVPDELVRRLKARAAERRRSVNQEVIMTLETVLPEPPGVAPAQPSKEEILDWLRREVWTLPVLDDRGPDEMLGYNEQGLPG